MDFGLSETQEMLRSSAREFLDARESVALARRAHSEPSANRSLWNEIRSLGWPGIAVSEQYGGSGLGFDDLTVLLEECAAGLAPSPLFETSVLGASLVATSSNDALRMRLLPGIADGDAILTFAHLEGSGLWDDTTQTAAVPSGTGWKISGVKRFVPSGSVATDLVVSAVSGSGSLMLFAVGAGSRGVEIEPVKAASAEPYATVRLSGVGLNRDDLIASGEEAVAAARSAMRRAAVVRAAQMAAVADAVVRRTVEYASGRKQFGHPIGSYQAVQHRLADMATASRGARHLARAAAWQTSSGGNSEIAAARAKSFASEHMPQVCWDAHQLHGAIGFTWEHDLHLYTRRVLSWRAEYGDARYWRRVAADLLVGA